MFSADDHYAGRVYRRTDRGARIDTSEQARHRSASAWQGRTDTLAHSGLYRNGWLWAAVATSLALPVAMIYTPFLQQAFSTTALDTGDWVRCAAVASSVLWLRELTKLVTASAP